MDFVHKTLSTKPNAVWKAQDYAALLGLAASHHTYVETLPQTGLPDADTLHYRIEQDTTVQTLHEGFLRLTRRQMKKLRGKRALVIIDYTHEPFFGKAQSEWVHAYKPAKGSRGCFRLLA